MFKLVISRIGRLSIAGPYSRFPLLQCLCVINSTFRNSNLAPDYDKRITLTLAGGAGRARANHQALRSRNHPTYTQTYGP